MEDNTMPQQEDYLGTIPVGKLGIIALESSKGIAKKVDDYIVDWREARNHEHTETIHFNEYKKESDKMSGSFFIEFYKKRRNI